MAKKVPEINSSSQADIAFLLLCFFLMTTSMDVDYGITRRLPPPVEQNVDDVKVKERNVMNVLINKNNKLMVNGRPSDISLLKDDAKNFMTPHPGDETAPEVEPKTIELLGEVLTDSTKKNVQMRADAEQGACAAKLAIAKRAKELGYDAIHDTVHEMAKDEARHGKAFQGLLNRYFK